MADEIKDEIINETNLEEEDMDTVVTDDYNEDSIQVLEGLEAVYRLDRTERIASPCLRDCR